MAGTTGEGWHRRPRLLARRVRARLARRPYGRPAAAVVNGFPKGGTHLLARCVTLLGGVQRVDFFFHGKMGEELRLPPVPAGGEGIPQGIGEPTLISREGVERVLSSLWAGEFAVGHIPHSSSFEELLQNHRVRMLFILRDPRDAAVSLVHHITSHPENRLHEYFTRGLRSFEERLLAAIEGVESARPPGGERLGSIGERLRSVQPWLAAPMTCTTRFERLVGPEGGGSVEAQQGEIETIARHLALSLTPEENQAVASQLFGQGSPTFRRGQLGAWKESFKAEHKAAFKRVAGQELVALGYERALNW